MVNERTDKESRNPRFRDYAAMVSMVGPFVLGVGIIGKFYVDAYRLGELEKRNAEMARDYSSLRDRLYAVEAVAIKEPRFERLESKLDRCCSRASSGSTRRWNDD